MKQDGEGSQYESIKCSANGEIMISEISLLIVGLLCFVCGFAFGYLLYGGKK